MQHLYQYKKNQTRYGIKICLMRGAGGLMYHNKRGAVFTKKN